jgi:antibiotic biosynthesis monooxygenase (ABM) superfamily enzyme
MSAPAVLIATAKLRSGNEEDFNAWQARQKAVAHRFPGFISSDLIPPTQPNSNEWIIILNFQSRDDLAVWQRSSERAELIGEVAALLEGGTLGEVAQLDGPGAGPGTNITDVIFTKIKPGMNATYRDWAVRIQVAQSKYAAGNLFPGLGTDQSAHREGSAELENCFARHSGRVPRGDARDSLSQSTPDIAGFSRCSDDFHRQLPYRGRHDLYSHAAFDSLVWLVAICRPKRNG